MSEFDRCQSDQIVVASVKTQRDFGNCTVHDPKTLRNSGSIGLYLQGDEAVFSSRPETSVETAFGPRGPATNHQKRRIQRLAQFWSNLIVQ